jgi:hypothetical protein
MAIRFYFDEHMPRVVAEELEKRSIRVLMPIDVGMTSKDDDMEHLPYAAEQGLVMVTFDRPFAGRSAKRNDHHGLICLAQKMRSDVGGIIRVLVEFSEQHDPDDTLGQVFWLP